MMAAARSRMICTSARRLALDFAQIADVRLLAAPREFPKIAYHMAWHSRLRDDVAQKWMRSQIRSAASDLR
jgi:DNA-binding transcriptional LysR family regulator